MKFGCWIYYLFLVPLLIYRTYCCTYMRLLCFYYFEDWYYALHCLFSLMLLLFVHFRFITFNLMSLATSFILCCVHLKNSFFILHAITTFYCFSLVYFGCCSDIALVHWYFNFASWIDCFILFDLLFAADGPNLRINIIL